MGTDKDDLILRSASRLGNDVVRLAVFNDALELCICKHRLAVGKSGSQRIAQLLRDTGNRDERTFRNRAFAAERTRHITWSIVVDDRCRRLGRSCPAHLGTERTGTSLNQRNLTLYIRRKVSLIAPEVGDLDQLDIVKLAIGRVGKGDRLDGLIVDGDFGRVLGVGGGEGLEVDVVVVASGAEFALDVLDGGFVARRAKDAVAFRGGVGARLERSRTVQEVFALDVVAQMFLCKERGAISKSQ